MKACLTILLITLSATVATARKKISNRFYPAPEVTNVRLHKKECGYIEQRELLVFFTERIKHLYPSNPYCYYRHRRPYTGPARGMAAGERGSDAGVAFQGYFKDGFKDSLWIFGIATAYERPVYRFYRDARLIATLRQSIAVHDTATSYAFTVADTTISYSRTRGLRGVSEHFELKTDSEYLSAEYNTDGRPASVARGRAEIGWDSDSAHHINYYKVPVDGGRSESVRIERVNRRDRISSIRYRGINDSEAEEYFPVDTAAALPARFYRVAPEGRKEVVLNWEKINATAAKMMMVKAELQACLQNLPLADKLPHTR